MAQLTEEALEDYASRASEIESAVASRIVGQPDLIRQTLVGLLASGHILLEGVPGLGKTELVKAFGSAVGVGFARVQFTPDLCLLYTSPSPRDQRGSRMPSSA